MPSDGSGTRATNVRRPMVMNYSPAHTHSTPAIQKATR